MACILMDCILFFRSLPLTYTQLSEGFFSVNPIQNLLKIVELSKIIIQNLMLLTLLPVVILACMRETPFLEEPGHGMGVRFTRRGLEKFCQRGYAIIPDILAGMPPITIDEIPIGPLKVTISNLKPRAVRVSTMNVYFRNNSFVQMEVSDGLMQLSTRLKADVPGIHGSVDCIFTLKGFGGTISLKVGDDPDCPYHFGLFNISSVVKSSGLDIDAIPLDGGGALLANAIQGIAPLVNRVIKETVLQTLLNSIFKAIKQSMLELELVVWYNNTMYEYVTDQRYINGINIIDNKVVANQGGLSMVMGPDLSIQHFYANRITSSPPKTIYTDRDYEFYVDREAINSALYAWHMKYRNFTKEDLSIPYATIRPQNILGLAEALVEANILKSANDPGNGVTLTLSVHVDEAAPHIPWIGAAAMQTNVTGRFVITASSASINAPVALMDVEANALFSATARLKKYVYGFANDQVRAHLALLEMYDLVICKENSRGASSLRPSLETLIKKLYVPYANAVLEHPGVFLMNGNFIDYKTVSAICLANEDRVLFVADIEKNPYFL